MSIKIGRFFTLGLLTFATSLMGIHQANAAAPQYRPTVIGGSAGSITDSPWQVAFIINGGTVCSGSFVSPTQIVSVAHCFQGIPTNKVEAFAGITKLSDRSAATQLQISKIVNHPGFSFDTYANDIALVTLTKPAPASTNARTIALPTNQNGTVWPAAATNAFISGWGETVATNAVAVNEIHEAQVQVLAGPGTNTCGNYGTSYIPSMQICAGNTAGTIDACSGDSGGPFVIPVDGIPVLAGAVSTGQSCASAQYPGLYTRMTAFLPWLQSQGVDVNAAGKNSFTYLPGTNMEGKPASFGVGQTYTSSDFARIAKLPLTTSRVVVTSGKACTQSGKNINFVATGKCYMNVVSAKKTVRVVVTLY